MSTISSAISMCFSARRRPESFRRACNDRGSMDSAGCCVRRGNPKTFGGPAMNSLMEVIKRPVVTEKGVTKKDSERTLCFEVAAEANKTQIRQAVQTLFKVKVAEVRTTTTAGKLRRRGRFSGYRPDWKKAYVKLKPGEKMPEYAEI